VSSVPARAAVFALELREEARRGVEVAALGASLMAFLHLALLLAAATVVIGLWDTHRLLACGGMAVLYGACAAGIFIRLRARASGFADAFPATREAFRHDLLQASAGLSRGTRIATWMRRGLAAARLSMTLLGVLAAVRQRTDERRQRDT
jgi:uncharacterized membrane protein YqjE